MLSLAVTPHPDRQPSSSSWNRREVQAALQRTPSNTNLCCNGTARAIPIPMRFAQKRSLGQAQKNAPATKAFPELVKTATSKRCGVKDRTQHRRAKTRGPPLREAGRQPGTQNYTQQKSTRTCPCGNHAQDRAPCSFQHTLVGLDCVVPRRCCHQQPRSPRAKECLAGLARASFVGVLAITGACKEHARSREII